MREKKEVFREELVLLNYDAKDAEDVLRAFRIKLHDQNLAHKLHLKITRFPMPFLQVKLR